MLYHHFSKVLTVSFILLFFILNSLSVAFAADGDELWERKINVPGNNGTGNEANAIAIDSSGDLYVVGDGYGLVGASGPDWLIKKFDNDGNEIITGWNKRFSSGGSGGLSSDAATDVAIDAFDNVYIVGYGSNLVDDFSDWDWWIKKFTSDGTEITTGWDKKVNSGGYNDDRAYSVAIDASGNVYVVGKCQNDSSGRDWWIKKYDSDGNEITFGWNKKISNSSESWADERALSIAIDEFDYVYVVGQGFDLVNASSGYDWWIKKFASDGTEITSNWNKKYSTNTGLSSDGAYSVCIDGSGNIYVFGQGEDLISGSSNRDWWIKKFDSDGNEDTSNWNKKISLNTNDYAHDIIADDLGNIYAVGATGRININWWIKKFNSDGNEDTENWNKIIDGAGLDDKAKSVAIDDFGNVYVAGYGKDIVNDSSNEDWWIKAFEGQNCNPFDINFDSKVDIDDLFEIVNYYGANFNDENYCSRCDINKDNKIDLLDLEILIDHFD